ANASPNYLTIDPGRGRAVLISGAALLVQEYDSNTPSTLVSGLNSPQLVTFDPVSDKILHLNNTGFNVRVTDGDGSNPDTQYGGFLSPANVAELGLDFARGIALFVMLGAPNRVLRTDLALGSEAEAYQIAAETRMKGLVTDQVEGGWYTLAGDESTLALRRYDYDGTLLGTLGSWSIASGASDRIWLACRRG